jgi:putative hydrolase of the HAD superfamily
MPAPDDGAVPRTLLVDYAEVITVAQPAEAIEAMAGLLGLAPDVFHHRYWQHRPPYDRGGSSRAFWSAVAGAELDDEVLPAELARIDVGSWIHLNRDTLEVLRAARRRGHELAVFSNAPRDLAAAVAVRAEMALFETLVFSSEIGLTKPDPRAFAAALRRLGRTSGEVLFIDDRAANVAGAREAGLRALHFRSPGQLAAELLKPT